MGGPKQLESTKVIPVIEVKKVCGCGTQEDPVREVTQYWSLDGEFLAEQDDICCSASMSD